MPYTVRRTLAKKTQILLYPDGNKARVVMQQPAKKVDQVLHPLAYACVTCLLVLIFCLYVYYRPTLPLLLDYFGHCHYIDT
jgi:hypothetical protein